MEAIIPLVLLVFSGVLIIGAILGIIAYVKNRELSDQYAAIARRLDAIEKRAAGAPAESAKAPQAVAAPPVPPAPTGARPAPTPHPEEAPSQPPSLFPSPEAQAAVPKDISATTPPRQPSALPASPAADAGDRMAAALRQKASVLRDIGAAAPTQQSAPPAPPSQSSAPPLQSPVAEPLFTTMTWAQIEEKAGKLWMAAGGVLVLFLAAGFFAKYAIERGWLGPQARVCMGIAAGLVVLALGEWALRSNMRPLGQSLVGGGIAILYVSIYAAYGMYHLIPQPMAFGLLVCVTALGMTLAVVHDAVLISALAIIGGFLTPVMLSTGADKRDALFAYIILLDAGVLGVSFFRRWRALDVLAFAGTWALYYGWFDHFYRDEVMQGAIAWLTAFYALFLVLPFVNHLKSRTHIAVERFIMAFANAVAFSGFAWAILHVEHRHALGYIAIAMSACYLVLALVTKRRISTDKDSLLGFITMAVVFVTMSPWLLLDAEAVTVAWAFEAPALLYIGYRFRYEPVRFFAAGVLALATIRFFSVHWPMHSEAFRIFANREFITALGLVVALGAFAIIHRRLSQLHSADWGLGVTAGLAAAYLGLFFLHSEVAAWHRFRGQENAGNVWLALIWSLGAGGFLAYGVAIKSIIARVAGTMPILVAFLMAWAGYDVQATYDYTILFNARFGAAATVALAAFAYCIAYRSRFASGFVDRPLGTALGIAGGYVAAIFLHNEAGQWFGRTQDAFHGDIAQCLVWTVATLGFLYAGLRTPSLSARIAGLGALFVGACMAVTVYAADPAPERLIINARFGAALAAVLAAFAYCIAYRTKAAAAFVDRKAGVILGIAGGYALALFLHTETGQWFHRAHQGYYGDVVQCFVWTAAALGFLVVGLQARSIVARVAGLPALVVGTWMGAMLYDEGPERYMLFANLRFAAAILAAGTIFAYAYAMRRPADERTESERTTGKFMGWAGMALLLVLLSTENYLYFSQALEDQARAHWVAQMSVTVVWGVYAAALLSIGFWRRSRALRLTALALFGATCVKLVFIDIAHIQQIWRILAFFVLGLLMIAASYMYYRFEKQLEDLFGNAKQTPPAA